MLWVAVPVLLLVVGAVVAGAEWWARERGVQQAADGLAEALQADVEVHVVGRPLAWHLLRREVPHAVVVADVLPVLHGRAHIDRLRVELDRIRFHGRRDDPEVTADAGRFRLTLATDQLLRMITLPSYLVGLEVVPTGLRLQTVAGVGVDASVELDRDSLLVRPASSMLRLLPQPSFRLPLPAWPYGARVEGMTLHHGSIEAWGVLDPEELRFPARYPWQRVPRD